MIMLIKRQQSKVGQQPYQINQSPDEPRQNVTKKIWSPHSSWRGYRIALTSWCLPYNQSPVRCGSSLRTALTILRLITWQALWEPTASAGPAGFNTANLRHFYMQTPFQITKGLWGFIYRNLFSTSTWI